MFFPCASTAFGVLLLLSDLFERDFFIVSR